MSDIALEWDQTLGAADFGIEEDDLVSDGGLETAVLLSLFTDRQLDPGEVLPDGETDRRGWWADTATDRIGSRLWLLARSKDTPQVRALAEQYAREALAWMIEDRVCDVIDVRAVIPRVGILGLEITIHRPTSDPVKFRFNHTWTAQAGA